MKRPIRTLGKLLTRRSQVGQSIVLLAIAMVALIAFVGLVTDISLLFVRFSTLRRAIDSAAIAAAGQIREGRDHMDLVRTAYQFALLHGLGVDEINEIFVETCDTNPGDPELCTIPRRKLVRVTAQIASPTTFLRLLGYDTVILEATSTAEAAVLDVALVLDTSESMSKETCYQGWGKGDTTTPTCGRDDYGGITPTNPDPDGRAFSWGDPYNDQNWGKYCNDPNGDGWYDDLVCEPFKQVRQAAAGFIERLDFVRGDRVVIITFDRYAVAYDPDCELLNPLRPEMGCSTDGPLTIVIDNKQVAREVVQGAPGNQARRGIGVFSFEGYGSDRWNRCWTSMDGFEASYVEVAPCGNTNIGGGILAADQALNGGNPNAAGADMGTVRTEAVWVMVVLTDGAANATVEERQDKNPGDYGYYGYCPPTTFTDYADLNIALRPACRDESAASRHDPDDPLYDADDYARDMADFAGLSDKEGGDYIAVFTIGLGEELINAAPRTDLGNLVNEPWHGEALLRYIADAGDNGHLDGIKAGQEGEPNYLHMDFDDRSIGSCEVENLASATSCGNYFYAPDPSRLHRVFEAIADRMFTRVSR